MNLIPYRGITPRMNESVFVADGAQLIGDLELGEGASVWFNAVARADLAPIRIGARTNLQDGAIAHVNTGQPLIIGEDVSIGHGAIVHGCSIGNGTLVGMGAIVLNGARIGEFCLIGAGSLITENSVIEPYTLAFGSPAKPIRKLTEDDLERMRRTSLSYVQKGSEFLRMRKGTD